MAWKSFERYERRTNCRAWLFQILFNVVRHERRKWFKWMTSYRNRDVAVEPGPNFVARGTAGRGKVVWAFRSPNLDFFSKSASTKTGFAATCRLCG